MYTRRYVCVRTCIYIYKGVRGKRSPTTLCSSSKNEYSDERGWESKDGRVVAVLVSRHRPNASQPLRGCCVSILPMVASFSRDTNVYFNRPIKFSPTRKSTTPPSSSYFLRFQSFLRENTVRSVTARENGPCRNFSAIYVRASSHYLYI